MEQQHVKTFEGSPTPSDIFQPHRLGVELLSDMDGLFGVARRLSATGEYPAVDGETPAEAAAEFESMKGQRSVVIVTPGRMLMPVPAPAPGSVPRSSEEAVREMLPPDPPLNVSVVSYTYVPALIEDKGKAIPFLGFLAGFASIGHTVVVFEGHPSTFESGVRGSDVLMVDSGMVPFMQGDWAEVAFRVMRPGARVLVHDRENFQLSQLVPPGGERGAVPPGPEAADWYAGTLLRLLFIGSHTSVQMTSGEALPDLAGFATTPEQLEQVALLPFKHDQLDADEVIDHILQAAGWRPYSFFKKTGQVRIPMFNAGGQSIGAAACAVTLSKGEGGRRRLLIER
jgi:hypothetical protein